MMDLLSGVNVRGSPCALCPCRPVSVPSLSCLHQSQEAVGGAQSGASIGRVSSGERAEHNDECGDITALIALLETKN